MGNAPRPSSYARGYNAAWRRTRAAYLAAHPECECGCGEPATVVHHLDGLGPLGSLGHTASNLQALTKRCHDRITAREQPGGLNRRARHLRPPERHPGAL